MVNGQGLPVEQAERKCALRFTSMSTPENTPTTAPHTEHRKPDYMDENRSTSTCRVLDDKSRTRSPWLNNIIIITIITIMIMIMIMI